VRLRRRSHVLCIAGLALACADPPPGPPPRDMLGQWRFLPGPNSSEACRAAGMEFGDDGTFSVRSGAQELNGVYTVAETSPRYLIIQRDVRFNGQPNCQGIPATYVHDHYVYRLYLEIAHDTLSLYLHRRDATPMIVLVRGQEDATTTAAGGQALPNQRLKLTPRGTLRK